MATTPISSRLVYPELPKPVTSTELRHLFTPDYADRTWAASLARTRLAQVALLAQLKVFQTIGRFLPVKDIPNAVIAHIAAQLDTTAPPSLVYGGNRLYRVS